MLNNYFVAIVWWVKLRQTTSFQNSLFWLNPHPSIPCFCHRSGGDKAEFQELHEAYDDWQRGGTELFGFCKEKLDWNRFILYIREL